MQTAVLWGYGLLFLLSWAVYRKLRHPFVLFNFIWLVLLAISCIGSSGIRPSDASVYSMFLYGGIAFNATGYLLYGVGMPIVKRFSVRKKHIFLSENFKKRSLTIVQCVLAIYYIAEGISLLHFLLQGGSYTMVRSRYYSTEYMGSELESILLTYFIDPMILTTEILFAMNLVSRRYSVFTNVLMLFNIVMRAFVSAGRMILFELALILIFAMLEVGTNKMRGPKRRKRFTQRLWILLLVCFGAVGAVGITVGRTGGNNGKSFFATIAETLAVNFTGSFKYLSILLSKGRLPFYSDGRSVLAGLIDPFIMLGRALNLTVMPTAQNEIGNILADFYYIGSYSYNAMPTMYYFFYTDFGKNGVYIAGIVLAVIMFFAYQNYRRRGTVKAFSYYLLALLILCESPMQWLLFKSNFLFAIFYVAFFAGNYLLFEAKPLKNGGKV